MNHTFVVCAYKESRFLEECIASLETQTVLSNIIIATSTPNDYIDAIAQKHGLKVFVNNQKPGIGSDWNFALSCAETELITLAHQDDIYKPTYTEELLKKIDKVKKPIIYFTNYGELRGDNVVTNNKLLRIKHILLLPLRIFSKSRFFRRMSLAFGCPICCPSVTYVRDIVCQNFFSVDFKCDLDWDEWERLSKLKGKFIYNKKVLMLHRIHEQSATTELIGDSTRTKEDLIIFKRFWPNFIAKAICNKYKESEKSNG